MKYLKTYKQLLETISIFDSNWSQYIPSELSIVTSNGNYTLKLPKDKSIGHNTDVANLMNCIQIAYYQNTAENGDVTKDGEPDYLCFDITLVKNNDGSKRSPDTLKLNVDITYGDNMAFSFSIEKPNKVTLSHYTGIGSKYDPETKFSFTDESLRDIVEFFNRFGYELSTSDFKFLDSDDNSFKYKDDHKQLYTDKISDMDLKMRSDKVDINDPISLELQNNESLSNYTLDNWPNGTYKGSIKGYEVYSDEIDSGFKATTGYRNMFPIPCTIYIKDGTALAFSKGGILFSDDETQRKWKEEFGDIKNDPRMKNYL